MYRSRPARPSDAGAHGRLRWRRRERSRGQSMVEFALVLPLMLLLFAGAADLGRLFFNFVAVENAVKEGALYGARYPLCDNSSGRCPDPNNVQWRTENEARTAANAALVTPTSECRNAVSGVAYADLRDCVAGDTYVVRATIQFTPITPMLSQIVGGTINLSGESRAVVLNQAFDPTPGLAATKLILGTGARNAAELAANCEQPDPIGSPNYFRSPCVDIVDPIDPDNPLISAVFRPGDTISYKVSVRNNGGTNLTGVTMTDSVGWPGGATCATRPTTMNVNTSYVCSYTRTAPSVSGSGDTSSYANTVTVDSTETLPTVDAATVTLERPPADLQVVKFVSPYQLGNDGDGFPTFGTARSITLGRTASVDAQVWYEIGLQNAGGRTATGITINDSNGGLPTNLACPARPTSLAAGALWTCYYQKSFSSDQVKANTVTVASPDSPPDGNDADTATVTVAACTGTDKLVPLLIGKDKDTGPSAWTAAGFTGTYNNIANGNVVTQNRQAFSCMPPATTITVTKDNTP